MSDQEFNMKKVAVLQSNYLPWKGYFRIIRDSDLFIFYDDVKFTKNDWRNRNQVLINKRKVWLSIPVGSHHNRLINQVELPKSDWQQQHLRQLYAGYRDTPNFLKVYDFIEKIYFSKDFRFLSELNKALIKAICKEWLSINTLFKDSTDYELSLRKSDRVLELCTQCHAKAYISGPAAKSYLDLESFAKKGIEINWVDYSRFQKYDQNSEKFDDHVSIVDTLFHVGKEAGRYI